MPATMADLFDLRNKVALVTGGAMGIGARIAERVRAAGSIGKSFGCDVGRPDELRRLVQAVVAELGHLDILVNSTLVVDGGYLLS